MPFATIPRYGRCIGFARSLGYGALEVANLYAYVATDTAERLPNAFT